MSKVIAKGEFMGEMVTVEAYIENGKVKIEVNGEYMTAPQKMFNDLVKKQPPMGGTYYPEPNTLLCAYNVLNRLFFMKLKSIEVVGEIEEIPNEENEIY